MARKSSQSLSVPSGKDKDQRSKSRGKNKNRMVTKRYRRGIRNLSRERKKLLRNLQSNGEESKSREDGINGIGNEVSKKKHKITFKNGSTITFKEPNPDEVAKGTNYDYLSLIEEDRGKIYGDPFLSHQAIGLVWEGIFRNRYHEFQEFSENHEDPDYEPMPPGKLFPADLVAEFLAGFKLTRLSRPIYHQDSADDAKVYISFSERFRKS